MKLLNITLVVLILVFLNSCNKDDLLQSNLVVEKILAGEANVNKINNFYFNESLSIPQDLHNREYSISTRTPHRLYSSDDELIDFGVCSEWAVGLYNVHYRAFKMNGDWIFADSGYEFAVLKDDILTYWNGNISMVKPLNDKDIIDENLRWADDENSQLFLTYWCDVDEGGAIKENINKEKLQIFNENISNKYIGIRKKVGSQYYYGWINYSVNNCEKLILGEYFIEL